MPLIVWLSALAIVGGVVLAWRSIAGARIAPETRVRANLTTGIGRVADMREAALQESAHERVVRPAVATLARQARRFTPVGLVDSLDRVLRRSGMSDRWTIEQVLAANMLAALVGVFLGGMVFLRAPSVGRLAFLLFVASIFTFAPYILLSGRADRRAKEIERALADALDQITICVEAGLSFEAALARVAESEGALSREFARLLQDIQIGIPRARAMENLLDRNDAPDLRGFVHAFSHADRYGVPIAQVLRVQAAEMRDKRRQRAEERAMKIPVKIIFPVMLCILPALFVVLMGPAVMRVKDMF